MDHNNPKPDFDASGRPVGQHVPLSPQPTSPTSTERPPSNQQQNHNGEDEQERSDDASDSDSQADPGTQISDFNWDGLAERYHDAMRECSNNEAELTSEFERLMAFFRIWANAGHMHEIERTFSRLRTRTLHVQHSESELEQKRLHYIRVVQAFQSALQLLQIDGA
ncbi:hypothetical protein M011DRAFT_464799 [Sporormia fimetaria CBS 119925]|uniref:Uncharacterized protein n=1 Tax=Sporormia fimetaria CBS 119925 TaxID=1340428 RepID=A0A6A6VMH1_9PLEO|nr:hypothetical protein M011DRAFT_464799 [Sporormia fimetaria CBS 119925]